VAISLPQDVVTGLRRIHPDLGWAIVSLYERGLRRIREPRGQPGPQGSTVDLAQLSSHGALIVVDPHVVPSVPGVSVVPVAAGRAFLAFDPGRGLADLELAIEDKLRDGKSTPAGRKELTHVHRQIRNWRRSRRLRLSTRSIILVDSAEGPARNGRSRNGST
jgi:hypothetical protein